MKVSTDNTSTHAITLASQKCWNMEVIGMFVRSVLSALPLASGHSGAEPEASLVLEPLASPTRQPSTHTAPPVINRAVLTNDTGQEHAKLLARPSC
eukprot:5095576-Prymnesium_polylepis.1